MKVLHFHKDTLFALSKFQSELIKSLFTENPQVQIFPLYPLCIFFDDFDNFKSKEEKVFKEELVKINFTNIFFDENDSSLYINVTFSFKNKKEEFYSEEKKIKAAYIKKSSTSFLLKENAAIKELSLINVPAVKISDAVLQNNSWSFFNTRWIKLKK